MLLRALGMTSVWLGGGTANPPPNGAKGSLMLKEKKQMMVGIPAVRVQVCGKGEKQVRTF